MLPHEDKLLRLTLDDEATVGLRSRMQLDGEEFEGLDPKTHALVRLGALHALGAANGSYGGCVEASLAAGATVDEVVDTLIAVAPTVGTARVVAAAPELAAALGFDIDAALEAGNEGFR